MKRGQQKARSRTAASPPATAGLAKKWRLRLVQAVLASIGLYLGYHIIDLQLLNRHFLQNEGDKRAVR